ncbi:MAG: hypothetical protein U0414_08135 [Polyangiaceae bacterium]
MTPVTRDRSSHALGTASLTIRDLSHPPSAKFKLFIDDVAALHAVYEHKSDNRKQTPKAERYISSPREREPPVVEDISGA